VKLLPFFIIAPYVLIISASVKPLILAAGMHIPVLSMAGALHADFRLPGLDYTQILKATNLITRDVKERDPSPPHGV